MVLAEEAAVISKDTRTTEVKPKAVFWRQSRLYLTLAVEFGSGRVTQVVLPLKL